MAARLAARKPKRCVKKVWQTAAREAHWFPQRPRHRSSLLTSTSSCPLGLLLAIAELMSLADHLALQRIAAHCAPSSKDEALRLVAAHLTTPDGPAENEILSAIVDREKLGTTGVGSHVAMPHGRLPNTELRAALLLCPGGVPFDAIDGEDVHIVVGLIAPSSHPAQLLQLLADASRVLRSADARDALLAADSEAAALMIAQQLWQ